MSENTEKKPMTTAEALGKYRKELLDHGFDHDSVKDLVRDAAPEVLRDGLGVKA